MMFNIPNFTRRRRKLEVVKFVPARTVFRPVIGFLPTKDISGWLDRDRKVKWEMRTGRKLYIDEKTAREFQVKGYGVVVSGSVGPVSDDERAEILSTVTRINLGDGNG